MWQSLVDVAEGLGEPRTLVPILCHDCVLYFYVFEVFFIVMILMHVSFACGEIGNDIDEMVKYEMC